ncbi:MAG: hypothetical protein K9N55_11430 [Phycisphaerae bacterium]|nr:hypothetical protein [Phycisphaerae bacterium]
MKQHDPVLDMIHKADAAAQRRCVQVDVQQIYVRDRRVRQIQRRLGVAAIMVLVLAVILSLPHRPKPGVLAPETPSLAVLEAQADMLLARADFLLDMEVEVQKHLDTAARISALESKMNEIKDPLDQVKAEVDKAARAMVVCADRFRGTPGLRREAIAKYKRVVALFPDNPWADIAQKRLLALTH